jgi:hypothetical protein
MGTAKTAIVETGREIQRVTGNEVGGLLVPMTSLSNFKVQLAEFQSFVNDYLIEAPEGTTDGDYGTIPGTKKPTLFKSGAEKLCEVYGFAPDPIILKEIEDYEKGLFDYTIKCNLVSRRDGMFVGSGLGSCSSFESKYRYRDSRRTCPACGADAIIKGKEEYGGGWLCYGKKGGCGAKYADNDPKIVDQKTGPVQNPDMADVKNTVLKMAKKRALIDSVLSVTRSSSIFAQDLDDMAGSGHEGHEPAERRQAPQSQTSSTQQQTKAPAAATAPKERAKAPSTKKAEPAPATQTAPAAQTATPAKDAGPVKANIPPFTSPTSMTKEKLQQWARDVANKVHVSPDQIVVFIKRIAGMEDLKAIPTAQKVSIIGALEFLADMKFPGGLESVTHFVRDEALQVDFGAVKDAYDGLLAKATAAVSAPAAV